MSGAKDDSELVADDEIIYRRVSNESNWYDPDSDRRVSWLAFRPNRNDLTGISVWRAKYVTPERAALNGARPDRSYYVLTLKVHRLRRLGIEVVATSDEGGLGHATLATLSCHAYQRDKDAVRELAERIATELVEHVHGPFTLQNT